MLELGEINPVINMVSISLNLVKSNLISFNLVKSGSLVSVVR